MQESNAAKDNVEASYLLPTDLAMQQGNHRAGAISFAFVFIHPNQVRMRAISRGSLRVDTSPVAMLSTVSDRSRGYLYMHQRS